MNWRSLFGAGYAQDVIRLKPSLTLSLGFRAEFSTGWNEAHGRASTYTFSNGVISTQPHVGSNTFTTNNAKFLPEPRVGVAWSPHLDKTVVRAGFGMYNELQDALGYRTDQNAPFNPTYSIAALTVSQLPIARQAPVPAKALLVPGGVQPNLKMPTLISYSLTVEQALDKNTSLTIGYVGSHGYHELIGIDADQPGPRSVPTRPAPRSIPLPSLHRSRARPFRQGRITSPLELQRPIPLWPTPGPGFPPGAVATTHFRSTSTIASAMTSPFAVSTPIQRPWTTAIH